MKRALVVEDDPDIVELLTHYLAADGWTVKDHVAHLADWEASAVALLCGESRAAAMGIDEETFAAGFEAVNAAVHAKNLAMTPDEAIARLDAVHAELMATLQPLADEDLTRPYLSYQPNAEGQHVQTPVAAWVVGNTYGHYAEHEPWIEAILAAEAP